MKCRTAESCPVHLQIALRMQMKTSWLMCSSHRQPVNHHLMPSVPPDMATIHACLPSHLAIMFHIFHIQSTLVYLPRHCHALFNDLSIRTYIGGEHTQYCLDSCSQVVFDLTAAVVSNKGVCMRLLWCDILLCALCHKMQANVVHR